LDWAGFCPLNLCRNGVFAHCDIDTPLNFPPIKRTGRDPADTAIRVNFLCSLGLTGAIAHPAISRRTATNPRAIIGVCQRDVPKTAAFP
jgi:hypothetical protein